ncbi:MAG: protein-L-isoaspartate(D-aspartate) O-methyltransferase [Rhodospirillales bacterium]|nr:protein-L-isoaspartate(D-aspartate) O-methyltransferase [Rhodospirillales bacterium]
MSREDGRAQMALILRQAGITDAKVLAAMEAVPRDLFVPAPFKGKAFEDVTLPIGYHQTISQPQVVARMTQALQVSDRMKVLEIGTGSGYQTAVLAPLCRRLYTLERHSGLMAQAEERFHILRLTNITAMVADGSRGWPEQAPFDRIIVTAAAADVPPVLVNQLADGGVMMVPIGIGDHDQHLTRVVRHGGEIETEDLGPVRFVPLIPGTETEVDAAGGTFY